ncbi:regulatory protein TetR [Minicystis rosea]|nr:regulatory protein TetR [Minicystis rosea]
MPRPADRRAKIELLRAAEAVFVEHGLAAAKVEDITAQAGVSKGAFYLHFESKEDCFRQIIEAFVAKLAACLDLSPLRGPVITAEVFADHLDEWHAHDLGIFEFCWQNRGLMRLLLTGGGGAHFAYLVDEFAERQSSQIEHIGRILVTSGIYRSDVDPAVLPALISGAYERLVREMIKQPRRPDIDAWARQAQMLFVRGLLTAEALAVVDRKVSDDARARGTGTDGVRLSPDPQATAPLTMGPQAAPGPLKGPAITMGAQATGPLKGTRSSPKPRESGLHVRRTRKT